MSKFVAFAVVACLIAQPSFGGSNTRSSMLLNYWR